MLAVIVISLSACSSRSVIPPPGSTLVVTPGIDQSGRGSRHYIKLEPQTDIDYIAAGTDGALWFSEDTDYVGRIDMSGNVTQYGVPFGPINRIFSVGPDKAFWFSDGGAHFGQLTTTGTVSEFGLPQPIYANETANGSDRRLWWAYVNPIDLTTHIAAMTLRGKVTDYGSSSTVDLGVRGSDRNVWFLGANADDSGVNIVRVTPSGSMTNFEALWPSDAVSPRGGGPIVITPTLGEDKKVWFSTATQYIGEVDTAGNVSWIKLTQPGQHWSADLIRIDPDMYFYDRGNAFTFSLGKVTKSGIVDERRLPNEADANDVAAGPDQNIWFPTGSLTIVWLRDLMTVVPTSLSLTVGQSATLTVSETNVRSGWIVSSNPAVVSASQSGTNTFLVTGIAPGSATVTITDPHENFFGVPVVVQ